MILQKFLNLNDTFLPQKAKQNAQEFSPTFHPKKPKQNA